VMGGGSEANRTAIRFTRRCAGMCFAAGEDPDAGMDGK
jgi:hypothetical protein